MKRVTYGQLRRVLIELGFKETRRANGVALEHKPSATLLLFRPYDENDRMQPAEVWHVQKLLDKRDLLEPESFESLLTKAPA